MIIDECILRRHDILSTLVWFAICLPMETLVLFFLLRSPEKSIGAYTICTCRSALVLYKMFQVFFPRTKINVMPVCAGMYMCPCVNLIVP